MCCLKCSGGSMRGLWQKITSKRFKMLEMVIERLKWLAFYSLRTIWRGAKFTWCKYLLVVVLLVLVRGWPYKGCRQCDQRIEEWVLLLSCVCDVLGFVYILLFEWDNYELLWQGSTTPSIPSPHWYQRVTPCHLEKLRGLGFYELFDWWMWPSRMCHWYGEYEAWIFMKSESNLVGERCL